MNQEWAKKLTHPLWYQRREDILILHGYECQCCTTFFPGEDLHVHHLGYDYGKEPWEYPNERLECLCRACHKQRHEELKSLKTILERMPTKDLDPVSFIEAFIKSLWNSEEIFEKTFFRLELLREMKGYRK